MATWNAVFAAAPVQTDTPTRGDDEIRNTRVAIEERMNNEHTTYTGDATLGAEAKDWLHKAGSAVAFHAATASEPTQRLNGETLTDGQLWYDSTAGILKVYSGGSWVSISGSMPIGTIMYFSGTFTNNSTFPGWYKCDGANGTPDLITLKRFPRAASTSGGTGGSKTIATGNLPAHSHSVAKRGASIWGALDANMTYFGDGSIPHGGNTGADEGSGGTGNTGSGTDYYPPYMDLIPIIRIS